jgi:hypothetical protein
LKCFFLIIIIISKQIGKGEYGFKKSKTEWTLQQHTQIKNTMQKIQQKAKKIKKNKIDWVLYILNKAEK